MATATGSAGGMCGECVAAPTQQEGMLDTHDTGRTGNPNLGGRPHTSSSLNSTHTRTRASEIGERFGKAAQARGLFARF